MSIWVVELLIDGKGYPHVFSYESVALAFASKNKNTVAAIWKM